MKKTSSSTKKSKATSVSSKVTQASKLIKQAAARQKVRLEITDEQLQSFLEQIGATGRAKGLDPKRPFQINFVVNGKPISNLPVASCAYWGDTCCA